MSTTLVSFIGTGWRKKEANRSTYDLAKYDFGDGRVIESSMFLNAILKSEKERPNDDEDHDLSEAIIIGTKTSAWATLLEHHLDESGCGDLYLALETELEESGVTDETLGKLESKLTAVWEMPIKCIATQPDIDETNAFEIISVYFEQLAKIDNESVLIDITHGFRSMPILLMSALQFNESIRPFTGNIGVIYGELRGKDSPSPVRYLDAVWKGVELSRAIESFFQKFDASKLSSIVKPFWPSGADALLELGNSLQGNLLIWIGGALKRLRNALDTQVENAPSWFNPVRRRIGVLYEQLNKQADNYGLCLCIAEMFAERQIYGQAIMALQLSFEALLFKYYEVDESQYGNFRKTQELIGEFRDTRYFREGRQLTQEKKSMRALNSTRNMIAHGGSRSIRGGTPQAGNLPTQYTSYKDALVRISRICG